MKYIIVYGNPIDGFHYKGPFETEEQATEYADAGNDSTFDADWWLAPLEPLYYEQQEENKK